MRKAAAVLLCTALTACGVEGEAAPQSPPPATTVTVATLGDEPAPTFDGRLVIVGDGLRVFGVVPRGQHPDEANLTVVEMLTSQTPSRMHLGDAKVDVLSSIYDLDCATMRFRLAHQVMYARTGQPLARTNLENEMAEIPEASELTAACGREAPNGIRWGSEFSSADGFLAAADPILDSSRVDLPGPSIITEATRRQN